LHRPAAIGYGTGTAKILERAMSQEPTFPADAVPGRIEPVTEARHALPASPAVGAHEVVPQAGSAAASDASKSLRWQAGVAIGVGSAAIAAALIYANRSRS
jgi:hypothetical protein